MTNSNNFISKKLSEINEEADFIISSHLSQLDRISNDIRVLEDKLQKAGVPFAFVYVLATEEKKPRATEWGYADPYDEIPTSSDFKVYEDHCLVWGKTSTNEYRLCYNIYSTEDEHLTRHYKKTEEQELLEGKATLQFSRPFIETKSNIRLKYEGELPEFYKKLVECLKTDWDKDTIIHESPNYKGFISTLSVRGIA